MQANPKPDDEVAERAILALVLAVNPHYRTIPELSRDLGGKRIVKRAVSRLVAYGPDPAAWQHLLPTAPTTAIDWTPGERREAV